MNTEEIIKEIVDLFLEPDDFDLYLLNIEPSQFDLYYAQYEYSKRFE